MAKRELNPEVQAIAAECLRRARMAHEGEVDARQRGETEYSTYLLGIEHAYTAAHYQILHGTFTEDAWKP